MFSQRNVGALPDWALPPHVPELGSNDVYLRWTLKDRPSYSTFQKHGNTSADLRNV